MSSGLVGSSTHARLGRSQALDPGDRLVDVPRLVGVDGQADVRTDRLAGEGEPADVGVDVGADLELDLAEPGGDRLGGKANHLVVGVAEPARTGGVRRVAVGEQLLGAGIFAGGGVGENRQGI